MVVIFRDISGTHYNMKTVNNIVHNNADINGFLPHVIACNVFCSCDVPQNGDKPFHFKVINLFSLFSFVER